MRSDVPVGAFLSGGIVSLAKEMNPHLKTFSVGFQREGYLKDLTYTSHLQQLISFSPIHPFTKYYHIISYLKFYFL